LILFGKNEKLSFKEEASTSTGMKMYNKLKLNFKSETKGVVKTIDPRREEQVFNEIIFSGLI